MGSIFSGEQRRVLEEAAGVLSEARDMDGNVLKKGDVVGFKAGIQQTGVIDKINGKQLVLKPLDDEVFSSGYVAGQEYAHELAKDVWKEDDAPEPAPKKAPPKKSTLPPGQFPGGRDAKGTGEYLMSWTKQGVMQGKIPRSIADYPNSLGQHLVSGRKDLAAKLIQKYGDKLKMVDKKIMAAARRWAGVK